MLNYFSVKWCIKGYVRCRDNQTVTFFMKDNIFYASVISSKNGVRKDEVKLRIHKMYSRKLNYLTIF